MTAEAKQGNGNLAAAAFAAFAGVAIVAFLAYRGSDVGQLTTLAGNIGGGTWFGLEGFRDSFVGAVIAVLIGIAWFGLGNFAVSFFEREEHENRSHLLELAVKTAAGAALWSLIWFFLGIAGLYGAPAAVVTLAAGLILAGMGFRRIRKAKHESRVPEKPAGLDTILLVLIAVPVVLAFVAALAPPIAKDTLLYHFAVPKAFIAQGGNSFVEGNIASYLALGTEMHVVWSMLLGNVVSPRAGEAAAAATTFLFFPLLLLATFGWAREIGISRTWSLVATLIVATVPTAFYVASSGYIDIALALFVTLAVCALTRWWKQQTTGAIALIALFLGAALAIKLTAVFVFAAFALIILLRARGAENAGQVVVGGFAALLVACVVASPWYLRTWVATGSPVFPFYMSIWEGKATGWDVERSNLFQAMNSQYGGADKGAINYVTAPVRVSVAAQPERAEFFDGVLGVAFLIGLPLLVLALWKLDLPVEVRIASGVAGIMFVFWLFSSQQLRYLLPIVPALAIAISASAIAVSEKHRLLAVVSQYAFIAAAICGILTTTAWFLQEAPLRVVLGGEMRDQYLARNLDYYPYYQALNTDTAADAKVWLINMRRDTYDIERPVVSDYLFEDWTLRKMLWASRNVQELRAKAAAMGVSYVLTRHDFLFDYDRSTLVDDKKPRAENEAKLRIAKEFVLDPANTIKADSKFSLIKVPTEK
jgi:hypothetical protein